MTFSTLELCDSLDKSISNQGFTQPTPIQLAAIPPMVQGRDLVGTAHTGSGKTLAFALAVLQRLAATPDQSPRRLNTLVVVPTRELCAQVGAEIRKLSLGLPRPIRIAVVFGGVSINPQLLRLRGGADIVVATPGRLLDLVAHNALQLGTVRTCVLDEADRLLALGFADELGQIMRLLPVERQTILFSATFAAPVHALSTQILRDPVCIDVRASAETLPNIVHRAFAVDADRRTQLLRHLVEANHWSRVLVFVATTHGADMLARKLRKAGIGAEAFHGDLSQGKRNQVLSDFKACRIAVVAATDLAARGLDIAQLPAVVNFDLPRSAVDYVHRAGRTGRAGEPGTAVSFVSEPTNAHFKLIVKRQQLDLRLEVLAEFLPSAAAPHPAQTPPTVDPIGGIKGRRPNKKDKLRAKLGGPLR